MATEEVRRFTRYSAVVDDLAEAWAFVMDSLDRDGIGDHPHIEINPFCELVSNGGTDGSIRKFGVTVDSGMGDG